MSDAFVRSAAFKTIFVNHHANSAAPALFIAADHAPSTFDLHIGFRTDYFCRQRNCEVHSRADGYVHVVGRFEYRPLMQRALPQPKSKAPLPPGEVERDIIQTTVGFGWMGLDDKQITDITELTPVGPPIPAHIN